MVMAPTILRIASFTPVDKLFDYLPPDDIDIDSLQPGMRLAIPFGPRTLCGILVEVTDRSDFPIDKLAKAHRVLDLTPSLLPGVMKLCQWLANYYHSALGEAFANALPTALRSTEPYDQRTQFWQKTNTYTPPPRAYKQSEALALLADGPVSDATLRQQASAAIIRTLAKSGAITSIYRMPTQTDDTSEREPSLTLSTAQSRALNAIKLDTHGVYLLDGITGSGKTEVYLQAIAQVIDAGQQALVLVPEINLTPQTVARFKRRFGERISLQHSQLTPTDRLKQWHRAQTAPITIGTRSAIFAPQSNLGLVIIDEEHDSSYKEIGGQGYHARDLAIVRASQANIPVILGSATPSLESLYNVSHKHYRHLILSERATQSHLPNVSIVESHEDISPEAVSAISATLEAGYQALIFINQRGFAPTLICQQCQWLSECPRCDSRLTLHRQPAELHCHHCDYKVEPPQACPKCQSRQLKPLGLGTQRSELLLASLFAHTPIVRIDRDSARNKDELESALNIVHKNEPCLLVGTQMLAKGHHFSHVNLVVVLGADNGLLSTDFRGSERMGQLLVQVTGRSGRESTQGSALIQTQFADHPLLHQLIHQGYAPFAQQLLNARQHACMPPFSYLAMIRVDAKDPNAAEAFLNAVRAQVEQWHPPTPRVSYLGPLAQANGKRNHRYYFQLQIKTADRTQRHQLIKQLKPFMASLSQRKALRWHIDIDPIENT